LENITSQIVDDNDKIENKMRRSSLLHFFLKSLHQLQEMKIMSEYKKNRLIYCLHYTYL